MTTSQQNTMFNYVLPTQSSQYSSLYSSQTVFPNPNLFSPSNFNSFGQLDPWLPQPRLIATHSSSSTPELISSGRSHFDKLDSSNTLPCCGRVGGIETATIGMCSPLTAEAFKVVSKEFQTKVDSQNLYPNSQGIMNFNPQASYKFLDSTPSCGVSFLLLEQSEAKQVQECCSVDELCFAVNKNDVKQSLKENNRYSLFSEEAKNMNAFDGETQSIDKLVINENTNAIKDDKINLGSPSYSEGSDIIVEESDSSSKNSLIKSTPQLSSSPNCLVCCNKHLSTDQSLEFVKINNQVPLTIASSISVLFKLNEVVADEKLKQSNDCFMCSKCLNLVNLVDQLEVKLTEAKKQLSDVYRTNKKEDNLLEKGSNLEDSKILSKPNLVCEVCDKQFCSLNYLEKHKQSHTKAFSYCCEYCGKGFAVLQTLKNHLTLHSQSSRFQCELCGKQFMQKHNLEDHLKKHKGEYKYKCSSCHKEFIRRSVFKTHMLTHSSEKLICQHCGKLFKNLANLSVHIKICSGDLKFTCDKCEKKFPIKSLLRRHISIKHNSEYHFICSVCKKGFGKKSDLKTHMRSHSDTKPFKCSKCSNSYKSLSNLNQHLKVHSVNAVLECDVCGKKFTRQDSLKDHLNQHTGNKPYKCTTCWKAFANRINFNIHLKRHNGTLKQTPCPICGKMFSKGLKDHLTSHSGQKPYSCKQCLAVFTVKSSLNKHVKVKHGPQKN